MSKLVLLALALSTLPLVACGGDDGSKSDTEFKADVTKGMHDSIGLELANLKTAAEALQAAAPTHRWDATTDAAAITAMKAAWKDTRVAYEHVEGATAPLFGSFDNSMDARYDDFLDGNAGGAGSGGDPTPFDSTGITGMHAIERILFSAAIPANVTTYESHLTGYAVASFPTTDADAMTFKTGICQRLIDDAGMLHDQWVTANIDIGASYQGLVALMNEQKEKVDKASLGEEESRYSQITLFDLRNNLAGTKAIYQNFRPWVAARTDVNDQDSMIEVGFTHLEADYNSDPGDSLPPVPATWSSDTPTPTDLATPFGTLWQSVHAAVNPGSAGSVVFEMNAVAMALGLEQFVEGQ